MIATATCIGLSAVKLLKKDADAVMVVLPSDHYIEDEKSYIDALKQAVELANRRKGIITLGIKPTRPETGYGYIQMGERINANIATYKVERFTEKPNIEAISSLVLSMKISFLFSLSKTLIKLFVFSIISFINGI